MLIFNNHGVTVDIKGTCAISRAIEDIPVGDTLLIPLCPAGSNKSAPCIDVGKTVNKYSQIAVSASDGSFVLSPASGVYLGIDTIYHPMYSANMTCMRIAVNDKISEKACTAYDKVRVTGDEIISIAKGAGIIDEYDGLPLYQKLSTYLDKRIDFLAGYAIDDYPYCSSGVKLLTTRGNDAASGLEFCLRACEATSGVIFYSNCESKEMKKISDRYGIIDTTMVSGNYPVLPALEKKLSSKQGFGSIGVQALVALNDAVLSGVPATETLITVAGDAVEYPCNCKITIGTPLTALLDVCKLKSEPQYAILGNTMNGIAVTDLSVPATQGMRNLTLLTKRRVLSKARCIGCGRCIQACPFGVMPVYAVRYAEMGDMQEAKKYLTSRCTFCGACSAVCPSGRELSRAIRQIEDGCDHIDIYDWSDEI